MNYSEEKYIEVPLMEQVRPIKGVKVAVKEADINIILNNEVENLFPIKASIGSYAYDVKDEIAQAKLPRNLYNYDWLAYFILDRLHAKNIDIDVSKIVSYLLSSKLFKAKRDEYETALIRALIKSEEVSSKFERKSEEQIKLNIIQSASLLDLNGAKVNKILSSYDFNKKSQSLIQQIITPVATSSRDKHTTMLSTNKELKA